MYGLIILPHSFIDIQIFRCNIEYQIPHKKTAWIKLLLFHFWFRHDKVEFYLTLVWGTLISILIVVAFI